MIPVRLTIKGLYSYQNTAQTIEFGPLIEAGLFGIFGAVGSGKSSILEAITLALYGESERLNKSGDERNYNMMNLKSKDLLIDFEFLNYDNQQYRFVCTGKRSGKHHDKVDSYKRIAYAKQDTEWISLNHGNGETVTGLSYDNFKRTVIIPQGKFQEFLELTPGNRSKMLKDLFNLGKYDLSMATNGLLKSCQSEISYLTGQLSGYQTITLDELELNEKELKTMVVSAKQVELDVTGLKDDLAQQKKLEQWHMDWTAKKADLEKANQQSNYYRTLQEKLEVYQDVYQIFSKDIDNWHREEKELGSIQIALKNVQNQHDQDLKKMSTLEQTLQEVTAKVEQHPEIKLTIQSARLQARIHALEQKKSKQEDRIQKGQSTVDDLKEKINLEGLAIDQIRKQVQEARSQLKSRELWIQLKISWEKKLDLEIRSQKAKERLNLLERESTKSQKDLLKRFKVDITSGDVPSHLTLQLTEVNTQLKEYHQSLQASKLMQQLSQYADQLETGQPCPLCGSESHPHIAEFHASAEEVKEKQMLIEGCERERQELTTLEVEWTQWLKHEKRVISDQKTLQEEVQQLEDNIQELNAEIEQYRGEFPDLTSLHVRLKRSDQILQDTERWEESLQIKIDGEKKQRLLFDKYQSELLKIQQEIDRIEGEYLGLKREKEQLPILDQKGILNVNLMEYADQLVQKIEGEEQEYKKLSGDREVLLLQVHQLAGKLSVQIQLKVEKEERCKEWKTTIDEKLKNSNHESIAAIESILSQSLDVKQTQQAINQFHQEVHTLSSAIAQLETMLSEQNFDRAKLQAAQKQLKEKETELIQLSEQRGKLQDRILRMKEKLAEKQRLEQNVSEKRLREENLKTLAGLFRGNGFVDFVSTIYLREIVRIANSRFKVLTHNHYALELSEDNQFLVRDYLNEGHVRSVKTLSGGQTFQASLCLALAMAETLQQQNQSYQNFFFLDEGFGTLDQPSLELVLGTLKSLRKEGRVVGVISHVESLKEEIDRHIKVVNHLDQGSIVYPHV